MAAIRSGQVVVITGASSGIGRSTAHAFARHAAKLVLVARDRAKLEAVARETGADCLVRTADVNDPRALAEIAEEAARHFGRLDVWVNNAGVIASGDFTDVPIEEHRRVIETCLLGYVNGAHAALTIFKRQGFGTLIQNASVAARLVPPHMSSYVTAKFGVRGLTHALRQDLALGGWRDIHVCEINPGVIDTPAFAHAASRNGYAMPFPTPKTDPGRVAARIVGLTRRPRAEIFVGAFTRLGSLTYTLWPALAEAAMRWATRLYTKTTPPQRARGSGNLFKSV